MVVKARKSRRSKACERCRTRKVKCDELLPQCSRCLKAGILCPGPVSGSIFLDMNPRVAARHGAENSLSSRDGYRSFSPPQTSSEHRAFPVLGQSKNEQEQEQQANSLSLLRTLGQGRVDPFSAFAREINQRETFLLDFYVSGVISFYRTGSNISFHPPRDACFFTNIQSAVTMEAMFAYASGHLAKTLRGGCLDAMEARMYWLRAIQGINEALSDPSQRFLDGTIMAVIGIIHTIFEFNDGNPLPDHQRELNAHLQGLRCLISERGGFVAMCKDTPLSWILAYTDLRAYGELSAGWTPMSEHGLPSSAPRQDITDDGSASVSGSHVYPFAQLVGEYVGALRDFFLEAARRKEQARIFSQRNGGEHPLSVARLFRRGTPVHRLLTDTECFVNCPRLPVLFLLHIILWDIRDNVPSESDRLFKAIRMRMVDEGLDLGGSIDQLLWVLITDVKTRQVDSFERVFFLARLLRIHSRLSKDRQDRVDATLFNLLTPEDWDEAFEPEMLLSQIMADLGFVQQLLRYRAAT